MKLISSWSGGKDSCLACYKSIREGHNVLFLLNFISKKYKRCCFHGIEEKLIKKQAECIGIPLIQKDVSADMSEYEEEFKEAVTKLKERQGIEGMVFGDVYLNEHKEWVERVCKEIGIVPVEPLWNKKPEDVVSEFIKLGFRAKVVSAKAEIFDSDFVSRDFSAELVEELKRKGICVCGEQGEFHTFVYDGPIFKKRIEILRTEKILRENQTWKHWFLDIKEYEIVEKNL